MRRLVAFVLCLFATLLNGNTIWAGPPVAPTEALTPEEQRKLFKLPPGFEIQLVASEPEIQKPMNLAFDARGRLWVTHSIEYPFAVTDGSKPRDAVTVLEDFGPDGRARKASRFADALHIPIGVLPLNGGREVITWSIPNIWKLTDTDGDGQADKREILYGPFDFVDTHGNQNAFRLGPDGWIYACHGFRNDSKIKLRGEGEVVLHLNSGNTYRFRPDGSAIEQLTWGQVNPFGMCFDRWGNRFSADCHSKAITMLLRGGYYESFGKPHDGLGFAPPMTVHGHDSTGIAGVAYNDATHYPAEYRHSFFVGNVVTNVIHRDVAEWRGSSPWVHKPEDFVVCDDPWFHPVDLQIGPEGALYISDFYNSIIGHYEVDLKHPRRDRTRGRIWRVVWKGTGDSPAAAPVGPGDLTKQSPEQLAALQGDENITVRALATQQLLERGAAAIEVALKLATSPLQKAQAVWLRAQRGELAVAVQEQKTAPGEPLERVALLHAISESKSPGDETLDWATAQLADEDPFVQRAAADALGQHARSSQVGPLLAAWKEAPADDTQLIHTIRIALRKQIVAPGGSEAFAAQGGDLAPEDMRPLLEIAMAVPSAQVAKFVFEYIAAHEPDSPNLERAVTGLARWAPAESLSDVAGLAQNRWGESVTRQAALLRAVLEGIRLAGGKPLVAESPAGRWALQVTRQLLDPQRRVTPPWSNQPLDRGELPQGQPSASPWGIRTRRCADGQEVPLFDSIVQGEQRTGVLRSAPFAIPEKLSFWMCGHNGLPETSPPPVNHIRLRLVDSNEVIAKEIPPRNDEARLYTWELDKWKGQRGVIEVVDADTGTAYAWIGVGRFEPSVVAPPSAEALSSDSGVELALRACEALRLSGELPQVVRLLDDRKVGSEQRALAAQVAFALDRAHIHPRLIQAVGDSSESAVVRSKAAELLGAAGGAESRAALVTAMATVAGPLQQQIALVLASSSDGADALVAAVAAGKASARLLQEKVIVDRLSAHKSSERDRRIEELTKNLPAADERTRQLISQRLASFQAGMPSLEKGVAVFKKNCATCHRVMGEGAMIGPQLDGVGVRGPERLLEDILDPNRNVDAAFRVMIITTNDGQTITGLKLREEGQTLVLADNQGKERRVALSDIDENRLSSLSLMPTNVTDQIVEDDLRDLIGFLLQLKTKPPTSEKP